MKIRNAQEYSYYMKRLQIIAIMSTMTFLIFKTCFAHAHVELHFHSLEWEEEQKERERRAQEADDYLERHEELSDEEAEEIHKKWVNGDIIGEA